MPNISEKIAEFIKFSYKFLWYEKAVISLTITFLLLCVIYLILKGIKKEHIIDKIVDKISPKFLIILVFTSIISFGLSFIIFATKSYHDYKISYYPYSIEPANLNWSDTVYNLSYIFENMSDLPTEINDITFYIMLNKKGVMTSNLDSIGKEEILKLPLDSEIVKLIMPSFNLRAQYRKSVPLSLDYLRKNKHIVIITTCISVNNPERFSIKTEISWDSTKLNSPFSIKYDTTIDIYFDKNAIQENINYYWKPETTNDQHPLQNLPNSNTYTPRAPKQKNDEKTITKERRKLSENVLQDNNSTNSITRKKLSDYNSILTDSINSNKRRKLSNSK